VTVGEDVVPFETVGDVDLVVDQLYDGGRTGSVADDPLARMLPVGNQGGFRYAGSPSKQAVKLAALYTTGAEPDWPGVLDPQTELFTY
jgi:AspBHI-like restriction endonuclease